MGNKKTPYVGLKMKKIRKRCKHASHSRGNIKTNSASPMMSKFQEINIHHENKLMCNFCLSRDRYLLPVYEYIELTKTIFNTCSMAWDMVHLLLCWECRAMLRNIKNFIEKVKTAQAVFINSAPGSDEPFVSLSTLGSNLKTEYNVTLNRDENIEVTLSEIQVKVEYESDAHINTKESDEDPLELANIKKENDNTENSFDSYPQHDTSASLLQPIPEQVMKPKEVSYTEHDEASLLKPIREEVMKLKKERYKFIEGVHYRNLHKREKDGLHKGSSYKCEECKTGFCTKIELKHHTLKCRFANIPHSSSANTKQPKTASQRNKEYRERKKMNPPDASAVVNRNAKTDSQRSKEYRERKKRLNPAIESANNARRCSEYRRRLQLKRLDEISSNNPTTSSSSFIFHKEK